MSNDKKQDIHAEAIKRMNQVQEQTQDQREQALEDRRFYSIAGAQWEGDLARNFAEKPKFEVNKIHLSVIRIINEYLTNRITVDYTTKDGDTSDDCEMCSGLYRSDEQASNANEAYDNAFEEAVGGGFGAFKITAIEEDDEDLEDDKQRIAIDPIFDADATVFFDLDAKRQDKRDARYCFVLKSMTHEAYEEEFPEGTPVSVCKLIDHAFFDWTTSDSIYIAEYYVIEEKKQDLHIYEMLDGTKERYTQEELEESIDELQAIGARHIKTKKVKDKKVKKYIISGAEILEDCGYIAGKNIPIIPVYGKRWFVDGIERFMGHVRLSKDAQRLKNMQVSKLAEISALSSIEKPIFLDEQTQDHQVQWARDNIENYPFLNISAITGSNGEKIVSGPVGYTKPPQVPPAMAALLQVTENDIKEMLGRQEAGEELNSNVSGNAIELVQNKLDMQSYIYMDNMAKAIKRAGEVWLSMARELYIEDGRKMKVIDSQGIPSNVVLAQKMSNPKTGKLEYKNDLTKANFDVNVNVGPSSTSRKQSTIRALMAMMQITTDQQTMDVLSSMAMMNMEGEGIDDVKAYFRKKMINMGVVEPNDEEKEQIAEAQAAQENQPPDPQTELLKSAALKEQAQAEKARADTIKIMEDAKLKEAQTVETYADIDNQRLQSAIELASKGVAAPP